jgi:membrane-bound ClpP family serine protease
VKNILYNLKIFAQIPARVYVRYFFFQLPGLGLIIILLWWLTNKFDLPSIYAAAVFSLWLIKDIVMFPFLWRSYDTASQNVLESMIGRHGTAVDDINPCGYVRIGGEMWRGEVLPGKAPVKKGDSVIVTGVDGLMITVELI